MLRRHIVLIGLLAAILPGAEPGPAQRAFGELKKLEGEWKGTTGGGEAVAVSYRLTAGGTVLMEDFEFAGKKGSRMTTMYHLDGERILLTHYCMAGNQPRMAATVSSAGATTLDFQFIDATNLTSPDAGHMHHAVIRLLGPDRLQSAWTYRKDGRDNHTETFEYKRVR
ncbi:MAG: hypothetical protein R2762_28485 [Bryobacteraceae bacterium]